MNLTTYPLLVRMVYLNNGWLNHYSSRMTVTSVMWFQPNAMNHPGIPFTNLNQPSLGMFDLPWCTRCLFLNHYYNPLVINDTQITIEDCGSKTYIISMAFYKLLLHPNISLDWSSYLMYKSMLFSYGDRGHHGQDSLAQRIHVHAEAWT